MRKSYSFIIVVLVALFAIVNFAFAEDGVFTCDSKVEDFNGKTFDNLSINLDKCNFKTGLYPDVPHQFVMFENVTVTGEVNYEKGNDGESNHFVNFVDSKLNTVNFPCAGVHYCQLGINGGTSIEELNLYPSGTTKGNIILRGNIDDYIANYPINQRRTSDWGEYEWDGPDSLDGDESVDYMGEKLNLHSIPTVNVYSETNDSIMLVNTFIEKMYLKSNGLNVSTSIKKHGMAEIQLLDSEHSAGLENCDPYGNTGLYFWGCLGLLLIHPNSDQTTISSTGFQTFYLMFLGDDSMNQTLVLNKEPQTWENPLYGFVGILGANLKAYSVEIQRNLYIVEAGKRSYNYYLENIYDPWWNDEYFKKRDVDVMRKGYMFGGWLSNCFCHADPDLTKKVENVPALFLNAVIVQGIYVSENYEASNAPEETTINGEAYNNTYSTGYGKTRFYMGGGCYFEWKNMYELGTERMSKVKPKLISTNSGVMHYN